MASWDESVNTAKTAGAQTIAPNNLPIRVIGGRGLLEHEHADHPDYKFPVLVEEDADDHVMLTTQYALIFSDGTAAIMLHEHSYYVCPMFAPKEPRRVYPLSDLLRSKPSTLRCALTSDSLEVVRLYGNETSRPVFERARSAFRAHPEASVDETMATLTFDTSEERRIGRRVLAHFHNLAQRRPS